VPIFQSSSKKLFYLSTSLTGMNPGHTNY
jgi:hypothetical protein